MSQPVHLIEEWRRKAERLDDFREWLRELPSTVKMLDRRFVESSLEPDVSNRVSEPGEGEK